MHRPASSRLRVGRWLRTLGQVLALVAQVIVLAAPVAEAHEERGLAAHVEAPGNRQHAGHNPERCPACILIGVHSSVPERAQIPAVERARRTNAPAAEGCELRSTTAPANSCRAPPAVV